MNEQITDLIMHANFDLLETGHFSGKLWHDDAKIKDIRFFCERLVELGMIYEREACAKVCEQMYPCDDQLGKWLKHYVKAIRARGEVK